MNQIELNKLQAETYDHLWNGRYRLALKTAKTLFSERPNDSEAAICLAWALLENGSPTKAMDYANLAVELNGDSIRTHLCRGYILMRLNIFEGSVSDLDKTIIDQRELLAWSYLNKARALAGMNNFKDAKLSLKLCLTIAGDKNSNWKDLVKYYDSAEKFEKEKDSLSAKTVAEYMDLAKDALKDREIWFALNVSRYVLGEKKFEKLHEIAQLIELEAMLHSYQFKPALKKAEQLKSKFKKNKKFEQIRSALEKMYKEDSVDEEEQQKPQSFETKPELKKPIIKKTLHDDILHEVQKKTAVAYYPNENVEVFSLKVYNQHEIRKNGKKIYYSQFDIKRLKEIGIEVIFSNPHFRIQDKVFNCRVSWYLNDYVIFNNEFSLKVDKDWDSVIFNQQCGIEEDTNWAIGQAKVELYVENFKVCEKWFFIDQSNVPEESEADKHEPPADIPKEKPKEKPTAPPSGATIHDIEEFRSIEELLEELDSFTGLNSVKKAVRDFVDYLEFQKARAEQGLKDDKLSLHIVFTGNPGTGKTTIARLMGEIFKSMGIVEKGHVVEVDRSALVGQYIGETAQKTEKIIEDSLGGILFIDEAYTLVKKGGGGQDFGQEAIDVLLKRMEDKKGEFIVIVAGYPDEMNTFLESNPGIKSRFNHTFNFEDYTPDELIKIFKSNVEKEEYSLDKKSEELLKKEFTKLYRSRDKTFGNARLARQILEKVKLQLGKRYLKLSDEEKTKEALKTILEEDIIEILRPETEKQVRIPIDEESLSGALNELNNLVGLESVKNDIKDMVKLVKYFWEQGEDAKDKFSSHVLFLGNPGTGKTTAARILSKIYSALGILSKGHLVETDRTGLVASHIGGTAEKTTQIIDKAIGGTLFIDEAYTLTSKGGSGQDFGKEAIDTLLKRMEDDRGKFIVIAAGYTEEMKSFIESNPGIQSRFTKTFTFEDYTPHELIEITHRALKAKELKLQKECEEELAKHYNEIYRARDKNFGNARIVRNIIEKAIQKRLLRLADLKPEERESQSSDEILLEDIEYALDKKIAKKHYEIKGDPEKLEKLMDELRQLTGLDSVKDSVEKLISGLKVAKMRKERGLKVIEKSLHSVFMGNPGTGKTTVARLLSKIYKELGLLEKGHLIEVDRSALVAGYQGQTATKTDKVIERSLGGTLFIDEAYTLARGTHDFGQEAIDTLLKRMEDYRGQFIVIVAGYTDEMKGFLESNPGLKSRFSNIFTFEDYTARQLLSIAVNIAEESGYKLDEGALQLFLEVFKKLYDNRDKNFGNARTARNILYKAISFQEARISSMYDYSDEDLMTIVYEDVEKIPLDEI